jgi:hypothetical protein
MAMRSSARGETGTEEIGVGSCCDEGTEVGNKNVTPCVMTSLITFIKTLIKNQIP